MFYLVLFSLILGITIAYLLEALTNRLLQLYNLSHPKHRIYYIVSPVIALLVGIKNLPLLEISSLWSYGLGYTFLCLLTLVAVMDYYTLEVRHRFVLLIGILGIIQYLLLNKLTLFEISIGFFAASLPFFIISILTQGSIGGGDIKLLASCGLVLGYVNVLVGTFLAIILGGIYGILLLSCHKKKKQDAIPFVPFLSLGLGISYLWGPSILNWYLSIFI